MRLNGESRFCEDWFMSYKGFLLVLAAGFGCVGIAGCGESDRVRAYSSEVIYCDASPEVIRMAVNSAWATTGCDSAANSTKGWRLKQSGHKEIVGSRSSRSATDADGNEVSSQVISCTGEPTVILIDCEDDEVRSEFIVALLAKLNK